ncbi:MAG: hypothetical protein KDA24_29420 [Deltaproteobacteria bacterium]|nr:hypothetical protein [Deltaproteobacteria bacterium]
MSLQSRLSKLETTPDVRRFLRVLASEDPDACTRLLDDRAASGAFALDYWAPRMLAGALSDAEFSLLAVPVLMRASVSRAGALRLAARLELPASTVDKLVDWGLWRPSDDEPGLAAHPAIGAFASDPADLRAPGPLLDALLRADALDEIPETALGTLTPLVLAVATPEQLAEAAPRIIDSLQLADRLEDAVGFGGIAVDRLEDESAKAVVLLALAEALTLDEEDVSALVHLGMAAAFAPDDSALRGACRVAAGEIHLDRGEVEAAGIAFADAHRAFVASESWADGGDTASSLGALAIVANDLENARNWLLEAVRLGGKHGDLHAVADAYDLLAELERAYGNGRAEHFAMEEAGRIRGLAERVSPRETVDEEQESP